MTAARPPRPTPVSEPDSFSPFVLGRGFSLYLDAVRLFASLLVFASHLAYARYTDGKFEWIRNLNLGSDAVVIFFVLSGFVIAHTTLSKHRPAGDYSTARLARLYSVVLPAILLTLCLDSAGATLFPDVYDAPWYNADHRLTQMLTSLTFLSQGWGGDIRLGTNGPFWSVAYEAWYYVAFGVAIYCQGRTRSLLLVVVALIAGPRVLLLLPCWLLGVVLQKVMNTSRFAALGSRAALAFCVLPLALYAGAQTMDLPALLTDITTRLLGGKSPKLLFGFSDEFLWNVLIGIFAALHFMGTARLLNAADQIGTKFEAAIRWGAGATFSIYLFHNPILSFLHALPIYDAANPLHWLVLTSTTLAACFALAELSERRLTAWKAIFSRLTSGLSRQPA
ncbi:acyltransferase [Hyphomonas sp.]|jgi:peptidoglycan/LPS O-acetylase OafA/YrhL|uniref:acyltransferase family protein n=1 Tax=Hyphomonas sp. TaxID=87 RepID=UPI0032D99950